MENKRVVIANMKMNMTFSEIEEYLKIINNEIRSPQVIFCPTAIYTSYFLKQKYRVGLQNVFIYDKGAYTGEVSSYQAASMGIQYVIIGHSERRIHFKETDSLINKKVHEAVKHKLGVILCIGETIEERNLLKTDRVLKRQILNCLNEIEPEMLDNIVIAYEPIWSIGTGLVPTNREIQTTVDYIKLLVKEYRNYDDIKVIYGGSVDDKNIKTLNSIDNIFGFLVGSASLNIDKFRKIIAEVIK